MLWWLASLCLWVGGVAVVLLVATLLVVRLLFVCRRRRMVPSTSARPSDLHVGVFHPYCNAGGGGERVLWVAMKALEALGTSDRRLVVHIYTGDHDATPAAILAKAKSRFFVDLSALDINFVYISQRRLLEASLWPRFTMLGQSLGSLVVAFECLWARPTHVFLDTTGYAFTYIVAKLAGCRVASYTHYPTITTEMLQKVYERRPTYNNDGLVAGSVTMTTAKVLYYRVFSALYRVAGSFTEANMVNSNWTKGHIDALWGHTGSRIAAVVFPPCNTAELQALPLGDRKQVVLSIGQFRPEKDHLRQVLAFAALKAKGSRYAGVKLVMIGGARDDGDRARVADLKAAVAKHGLEDDVEFMVNAPFSALRQALATSLMGLHTMWNEHFGIGVVEMMAAGVVPIAHNSGGPKADIVVPFNGQRTGFLATEPEEYADAMAQVLDMAPADLNAMTAAARESATRFSDEAFSDGFVSVFSNVVES